MKQPKPKVHYTADHVLTSCFIWVHAVDVTTNRRSVTCKNCKRSRKYRTKRERQS